MSEWGIDVFREGDSTRISVEDADEAKTVFEPADHDYENENADDNDHKKKGDKQSDTKSML